MIFGVPGHEVCLRRARAKTSCAAAVDLKLYGSTVIEIEVSRTRQLAVGNERLH